MKWFFGRKQKRKRRKGRVKRLFIDVFIVVVSLGIFFAGGLAIWIATLEIPDFKNFDDTLMAQSTKIYDRTGEVLLYDVHGNIKRSVISLEDMSPYIKQATIALEDSRFYEHYGVRIDSIFRAAWANITSGELEEGGSTITQQVIKNTLLTDDKNFVRKAKEAVIALKMETILTKEEILEAYLNVIPYGGNIYGIQEAARYFFGKNASDLGLVESVYIASLPKAPTYYSPYGNHRDVLEDRKDYALRRMYALGYINKKEYERALEKEVVFAEPNQGTIKAPHFTLYVLSILEKKYGRDVVERAGLQVITTLDYELYTKAQKIVREEALANAKKYNANNMGMIGLDPNTGQILLMIGSRNWFETEKIPGKFNVTTTKNRQPGSSFKPIVYATAFKRGYTPETVVFDLPTQFSTACGAFQTTGECGYSPENYDDRFRGPITLRNALAQSINIPAVKTLYLSGIKNVLETAEDFGISNLGNEKYYGLSLALGSAPVSVLDMAGAYAVFANAGIKNKPTAILKITNKEGEVLYEDEKDPDRVLEEQIAFQISDILSSNTARAPLYGLNSPLYFDGLPVAAKTGTTNNFRDAWTVGYTKNFVLAAWAGNNDGSQMANKVSGFIISPAWHDVMLLTFDAYPSVPFEEPKPVPGNIKPILRGVWNPTSNLQRNNEKEGDNKSFLESFLQNIQNRKYNSMKDVHSILYYVDKNNPQGPVDAPGSDPQYFLWELPVRAWVENGGTSAGNFDIPTQENNIGFTILEPDLGEEFERDDVLVLELDFSNGEEIKKISFFINNTLIASEDEKETRFFFSLEEMSMIKKENVLKVVVKNEDGGEMERTILFEVN